MLPVTLLQCRHLFQLQNSIVDYVASHDFRRATQSGCLRILDVGAGPAVASIGLTDMIDRTQGTSVSETTDGRESVHMTHILNDTSPVCLETGKRMLTAFLHDKEASNTGVLGHRILTLSTAFPGNMCQIRQLASLSGHFDLAILSYVIRPLADDGGLRNLVKTVRTLEPFCKPEGRVLLIQDKFREPLIRQLADMISVQYREQTLTQEIYPPRGSNEKSTYTYFDCLFSPRQAMRNRYELAA